MKTLKFFSLVTLFFSLLFLGCTEPDNYMPQDLPDAQLKSAENRSVSTKMTFHAEVPITCDGVEVEWLVGDLKYHFVDHFHKGEWAWWHYRSTGTLTSESGENFYIKESGRVGQSQKGEFVSHSNIKGDQGSHVILSFVAVQISLDPPEYEVIFTKAKCVSK